MGVTGSDDKTVAAELGCAQATVGKWRGRFVEHRLDGPSDDDRPGRPASITAEQVEDVVVATLQSVPANATHWSRAKMDQRSGLSTPTIGRVYLNPPEAAVVLSVDEKSQVQALARSQPAFPMMPGMPEKRTHDYLRYADVVVMPTPAGSHGS